MPTPGPEAASSALDAPESDPWLTALEGLDLIALDPAACRIHGDPTGRLWGTVNGKEYAELLVHMAFPLTDPEEWLCIIAVEDPDSDGRRSDGGKPDRVELGVLQSLAPCDEETRQALAASVRLRYFLPRVLEILDVVDEAPGQTGALVWNLVTDRGPVRLRMANLFEGITELDTGRLLLSDRDGNRVDIADVSQLDPSSRRLLERYYWF